MLSLLRSARRALKQMTHPEPDYGRSARLYDAIYAFKDYAHEADTLRWLLDARGVRDGATLLDVACGTGAHLAYLKMHFQAEGLDASPDMLEIAHQRHRDIPLHQADMLTFDLGKTFDVVVCLFSAIGHARTEAGLRQAVANMARHVAPGGWLVIEPFFNPDAWFPGSVHSRYIDQRNFHVCRMNVSDLQGSLAIMEMHYLVGTPDGVENFVERFELGLWTREQMIAAFVDAGLTVEAFDDGLMGRGLYVGHKPALGHDG